MSKIEPAVKAHELIRTRCSLQKLFLEHPHAELHFVDLIFNAQRREATRDTEYAAELPNPIPTGTADLTVTCMFLHYYIRYFNYH